MTGLLLMCGLTGFAQDALEMQYTLAKGDRFEMTQHSRQENYLTLDGVLQRTTQELDAVIQFSVTAMEYPTATLEGRFEKLTLLSSGDNQQVSVNTGGDENDLYNKAFKQIIGKPFRLSMYTDGTIKDIQGLESLFDSIVSTLSLKKEDERNAMKQLLESQFGSEELKAKLVMVLPHYPSHAIGTGDSWLDVIYTDGFYHGRIDNYWKLDYGDSHTIKLSNRGKFTTDNSEVVDLGSGLKGTIDLAGETQGRFAVDPATGWPLICTQHTELNGKYTYKANRKLKLKRDLEVPVRVVSDINYHIKHL